MDGIVSFDGRKWNLEFNTDNSLLDDAETNTALVTLTGQILLGTDEGLFQYDPNSNRLNHLSLGKISIQFILETANGTLWVVARDQSDHGLLYSFEGGKWRPHLTDQSITTIFNHLIIIFGWGESVASTYSMPQQVGSKN